MSQRLTSRPSTPRQRRYIRLLRRRAGLAQQAPPADFLAAAIEIDKLKRGRR
jgi:hypothetical protein